ncbi:hypothetical protein COV16_05355 [Candidatus Woesearchaeota archaeon CG10_big_fil_rev_8_21_14_0_10_34_8]|nr:MAG: hypothetical protein COV16_05355 [Candidatus Woesearchaeota archaeon CG10_big_fil_rev_8_21_14_0_10_34_8]
MKRAQYAFEYLMVIAFGMGLLLIIGFIYFTQVREVTQDQQTTLVEIMANDILSVSTNVYHAGSISKKTIRYTMPEIVNSIRVEDDALVFNVTVDASTYDLVYYSNVPIEGYFPETKVYTEQIAHILVYNCEDNVLICTEEFGCSSTGDEGCS